MRSVEFLPERIRQQQARRRRLIRQGCLLGACALALALLALGRQGRIATARAELATLTDRAADMQRQVELIAPLERQRADLLIKKRIDDELGSRADCTLVLAELCRLMPPTMSIVSLDFKTVDVLPERGGGGDPRREDSRRDAAAWAAGPVSDVGGRARDARFPRPSDAAAGRPVRRVRLGLTGLAATDVDVANFIGQMAASPLFEDVNMGYTKTVSLAGRSARQFQASCYLGR